MYAKMRKRFWAGKMTLNIKHDEGKPKLIRSYIELMGSSFEIHRSFWKLHRILWKQDLLGKLQQDRINREISCNEFCSKGCVIHTVNRMIDITYQYRQWRRSRWWRVNRFNGICIGLCIFISFDAYFVIQRKSGKNLLADFRSIFNELRYSGVACLIS